jgi:hypothetical protein
MRDTEETHREKRSKERPETQIKEDPKRNQDCSET